jgi:hypothetical protein
VGRDDSPDASDLARSVTPRIPVLDGRQPEQGETPRGAHVDVRRLVGLAVFVGPEEEPVGPEAVNGGHADLAGCRRGAHHRGDRFTAAYGANSNIPTAEPESFARPEEKRPAIVRYPRNPDLDPQLVWKGKDEQDSSDLEVPAVRIYGADIRDEAWATMLAV